MGVNGPDSDNGAGAERHVVVGIDGSCESREAALVAARSARRRGACLEARVAVESASRSEGWSVAAAAGIPLAPITEVADRTRRMAGGVLDDVLRQVRREDGQAPQARLETVIGPAVEVLLDCARGAQELVVGHRGLGAFSSLVLGSVGMASVLHAPCPVTVVPSGAGAITGPAEGPVVVGVDGSEGSRAALIHALREAVLRASAVSVVVAYPVQDATWPAGTDLLPPQDLERVEVMAARALVDEIRAAMGRGGEATPTVEVIGRAGSPAAVLAEASRDAALLVVGHRGYGALRSAVVGSTGLGCVRHAGVPITVVPFATDAGYPARDHDSSARVVCRPAHSTEP